MLALAASLTPTVPASKSDQNIRMRGQDEAIIQLHGAWFDSASARAFRHLLGHIAAGARAKAFIPDYRLAPEYPFSCGQRRRCWSVTDTCREGRSSDRSHCGLRWGSLPRVAP